jgi:hypothetical protein
MKVLFLTAIIWDNRKNADVPKMFGKDPNYDYLLFTNLKKEDFKGTGWTIKTIDMDFLSDIKKNIIKSRYFKFMLWEYLQQNNMDYDIVFYCDATRSPKLDYDWEKLATEIINSESGIAQRMHVANLYHECDRIVKFRKDTSQNAEKMKTWLKERDVPEKMKCYENTAFGYDPKNEKLQKVMKEFWELYKLDECTHRDQPLWSYTLWKNGIEPIVYDNTPNRKIMNKMFPEGGHPGNNHHRYV